MKPDHWIYCVIDGIVYVVLFIILSLVLRKNLRLLARHEADESPGKASVATLLILLTAIVIPTVPFAEKIGVLIIIPCLLAGVFILMCLCWVSFLRGLMVMIVFAVATLSVGKGSAMLADKVLPKDRITLVKKMKISMGILEDISKLPDRRVKPMSAGSLLRQAKIGLKLQRESFVSAVAILKDPQALAKMTAQHTEDLAALGLLMDGHEQLTPEQLAEMGIVYEDAKAGAGVLKTITPTNSISEQDVQDVVAFLKSVRKDGSEVTVDDAIIVIREAMNRANQVSTNSLLAMMTNAVEGEISGSLTSVTAAIIVEQAETSLVEVAGGLAETGRIDRATVRRKGDPFLRLSLDERQAWAQSRTGLVVTAKILRQRGRSIAMVNGAMVATGAVVAVTWQGRSFPWRLKKIAEDEIVWEPVLVERDEDSLDFVPWK